VAVVAGVVGVLFGIVTLTFKFALVGVADPRIAGRAYTKNSTTTISATTTPITMPAPESEFSTVGGVLIMVVI
jgi:hypothetical protein